MKQRGNLKCIALLLLMVGITSTTMFGQNIYSTITKNVNQNAKSLQHYLNEAGDTLHLKSTFTLYKVEFINDQEYKVFEIDKSKKEASIALSSIPIGDYTVASYHIERNDEIYQYQKTIIFRMSRLFPINLPSETDQFEVVAAVENTKEPEVVKPVEVKPVITEPVIAQAEPAKKEIEENLNNREGLLDVSIVEKKMQIADYVDLNDRGSRSKKVAPKLPIATRKTNEKKVQIKAYNLSSIRNGDYAIQTRADYRRNNLRPNGKPYD